MVISMIFLLTGCLHNNGKGNIRIESEEEQTGILDEGTLDQCLRVYQSIYDDAGNDITDVQNKHRLCRGLAHLDMLLLMWKIKSIWHVQNNCRRLFRVKTDKGCRLYYISYCSGSEVLGISSFVTWGKSDY